MEYVNNYTDLEAKMAVRKGYTPTGYSVLLKPCLYFIKAFIIRLGFLDGVRGFIYHIISSRYVYIKEVKIMELKGINKFYLLKTIFKRAV